MCIRDRPQDTAVTVVANAEVVSESTKEIASNILLSFFIIPPFKRLKKLIKTTSGKRVNNPFYLLIQ